MDICIGIRKVYPREPSERNSRCSHRSRSSHFLAWYSPTVGHGNIGDNDINRIFRLCHALDALISRTTTTSAKKRNSIKRAQARMRRRIRNLVDEVHKKAALWLTKTFDIIVLPKFNSTQMSHRQKRKINSQTVRKMMSWAHARFRNRLLSKAEEFGKTVITSVSEAYTAKHAVVANILEGI